MAGKIINGNLAVQNNEYQIITIDASECPQELKVRTAAYARVSSNSEDQIHSFAAQMRYYTDLISKNPDWAMVDVYADEGISGRSAEKRLDFQRMLGDCRRGLIDRILVKSISRFARNTTDCLEALRELKLLGVSVSFEKEGIDTAKVSGEMLTATFAALAQGESESNSRNRQWQIQKQRQAGTYKTPFLPYGYLRENGIIKVQTEQALVVQRIFREYLSGTSAENIANGLCRDGIPSHNGSISWSYNTICRMLSNEKYIGDSHWGKYYSTDAFPPKCKQNQGEKDSIYAFSTHVPIISKESFQMANALLSKRKESNKQIACHHPFNKHIYCGCCNSPFHRNLIREKSFWSCKGREQRKTDCTITQIKENQITEAFLRLYYKLKHNPQLLTTYLSNYQAIRNRRLLWSVDVVDLNKKIYDLYRQNQLLAKLKAQGLIDPDFFISQTNDLTEQLRSAKLQKERLLKVEGDHTVDKTEDLIETMDAGPDFLDVFDGELFGEIVDKIIVDSNEQIRFRLKNGLELPETIERTKR